MTKSPETVRAFVAIEIPESAKSFLEEIWSDLKRVGADVKWVRLNGIHLTLKFLGETPRDGIPVFERDLGPVFGACRPFEIRISRMGAFPNLMRPRVIWAGLEDPSGLLAPLAQQVEEVFSLHGFKKEKRPFSPHLTLGRVRSDKGRYDLVEAVRGKMDIVGPSIFVEQAVLFQSILRPAGAEYRALCRFPLGTS
ncbi:MAG: RNA 2',3'-cyclic phosphodiesterase [Desulfomonilaceae bacterium]|nr:RNA 2',3'-cyclic phosphodiesterase [Desulfomonilaceae bacterium]